MGKFVWSLTSFGYTKNPANTFVCQDKHDIWHTVNVWREQIVKRGEHIYRQTKVVWSQHTTHLSISYLLIGRCHTVWRPLSSASPSVRDPAISWFGQRDSPCPRAQKGSRGCWIMGCVCLCQRTSQQQCDDMLNLVWMWITSARCKVCFRRDCVGFRLLCLVLNPLLLCLFCNIITYSQLTVLTKSCCHQMFWDCFLWKISQRLQFNVSIQVLRNKILFPQMSCSFVKCMLL